MTDLVAFIAGLNLDPDANRNTHRDHIFTEENVPGNELEVTPYTLRHIYNITTQPSDMAREGATIMAALEFNAAALLPTDTALFAKETALTVNVSNTIHPVPPGAQFSVEVRHTTTSRC